MVYAIIYSLFLVSPDFPQLLFQADQESCAQGFGIAVGSDLYFLLDPSARAPQNSLDGNNGGYNLQGVFHAMNGTIPITLNGQWTFTNQTIVPDANDALFEGNIACARNPDWQWWRQNISPYALIALVPIFSLFLCLNNLQPIRSKQLPVMIIIACIGFVTNTIANRCKSFPPFAHHVNIDKDNALLQIFSTIPILCRSSVPSWSVSWAISTPEYSEALALLLWCRVFSSSFP